MFFHVKIQTKITKRSFWRYKNGFIKKAFRRTADPHGAVQFLGIWHRRPSAAHPPRPQQDRQRQTLLSLSPHPLQRKSVRQRIFESWQKGRSKKVIILRRAQSRV